MPGDNENTAEAGPRSKRAAILAAAVNQFGLVGFEASKWSAVADEVGIGQTALYHYFESKTHCLFVVMQDELQRSVERFRAATEESPDPATALRDATAAIFNLTTEEVLQLRILRNYQSLLARPRKAKREEEVRLECRRYLELNYECWHSLLKQGMDEGVFPRRDLYLLTQAVLAQVISVWQWYRPGGELSLEKVSEFIRDCVVRLVMDEDTSATD